MLADSDTCGLIGDVAMEVRCAVFLRKLRIEREAGPKLVLCGEVVGSWPEPFDFYVLLDGVEVYYTSLVADGETRPLRAVLDTEAKADQQRRTIRVDLVQGPTLWFLARAFDSDTKRSV